MTKKWADIPRKARQEQAHHDRHHRHAGPFAGGKKRKPEPSERDLGKEYGWKQPEDRDFGYLDDVYEDESDARSRGPYDEEEG